MHNNEALNVFNIKRENGLPILIVKREDAKNKIRKLIKDAKKILNLDHITDPSFMILANNWDMEAANTICTIFVNTQTPLKKLNSKLYHILYKDSLKGSEKKTICKKNLEQKINNLLSILKRIDLYEELNTTTDAVSRFINPRNELLANKILVIHNEESPIKKDVCNILEKFDQKLIMLCNNQTNIENFVRNLTEQNSIFFSIIILTKDDLSHDTDVFDIQSPSFLNKVTLEAGFINDELGHERVCFIYEKGRQTPDDIPGAVYIPYDYEDNWTFQLTKKLKSAGQDIDLNKITNPH